EHFKIFGEELVRSSYNFIEKIIESFARLKDGILQPIRDVSNKIRSAFGLETLPEEIERSAERGGLRTSKRGGTFLKSARALAKEAANSSAVEGMMSLAGGSANRSFSGPRRASRFGSLHPSVAVSQNNRTDIHVQAAPGQSVNSLAQSIDGQARKVQEQDLRRAAKAFVPKKATAQ
ncbi:MAG: hypothetical protein GY847_14930, partial [Proteobacteria bacterium]|nr:hypothetical protein [Pseudomonadota bacterium]